MSEPIKKSCVVCGKELAAGKRGGQRKFCGTKCGSAYHNPRNAAKPQLPGGTAQCPQCGKEFERPYNTKRECCSLTCGHQWNWRKEVKQIRLEAKEQYKLENPGNFRAWVLSLHSAGYSRGAIALALNLPLRAFRGWIEQHNKECGFDNAPRKRICRRNNSDAQTPEEWINVLRNGTNGHGSGGEEPAETSGRQIYLVCGVVAAGKGADCFCADIQARLRMNPFGGDIFAFCGKRRDRVRYMFWDGEGFRVISRRRESGAYPWPPTSLGLIMPISESDFELLLCDDMAFTRNRKLAANWDSLHFMDDECVPAEGENTQ